MFIRYPHHYYRHSYYCHTHSHIHLIYILHQLKKHQSHAEAHAKGVIPGIHSIVSSRGSGKKERKKKANWWEVGESLMMAYTYTFIYTYLSCSYTLVPLPYSCYSPHKCSCHSDISPFTYIAFCPEPGDYLPIPPCPGGGDAHGVQPAVPGLPLDGGLHQGAHGLRDGQLLQGHEVS